MMKFSIILPIYNVEKYLSDCIESILCQTLTDYEVILVDDGSTDSSSIICDEYAESNKNIKVIHKKNGGQSDARNVGLKAAVGEYVFFVDSDDFLIDNQVLSRINSLLTDLPDVVAFKPIKLIESTGKIIEKKYDLSVSKNSNSSYKQFLELIDKDTFWTSPWCKVIRRKQLVDNSIDFESGLLGEDNDWYYKVVCHINSLKLINEPLYVYRQRAGSTTHSLSNKNLKDLLWIINKWAQFVNEGEFTEYKQVIRNSLAKQYCHAIIFYSRLNNSREFYPKLKSFQYLLKYSKNPRVKIFRTINKLLGLKGIIFLLRIRNKINTI